MKFNSNNISFNFSGYTKIIKICNTRKCPLRGHILAPPEGLRAPGLPGVNPGGRPRAQGVIPRRFKRKKNFVTHAERTPDGQTDVLVEIVM